MRLGCVQLVAVILPGGLPRGEKHTETHTLPAPAAYTLGRRYNRVKVSKAEAGSKGGSSKGQNDTCLPSTADKLSKQHGVSPATVKRAMVRIAPFQPSPVPALPGPL